MPYLYAMGAIIAGVLIEIYTVPLVKIFGRMDWAERYIGTAGTYTAWRLGGILLIIIGWWIFGHPDFLSN